MISHYDWPGGREAMLRFGPAEGPVVVAALPLFEEANRTRAFVVTILRLLAERGIGSALPDLPGTGESLALTSEVSFDAIKTAFASASRYVGARFGFGVRSGALLDGRASLANRYHFAPVPGHSVVRELAQTKQLEKGWAESAVGKWLWNGCHPETMPDEPLELAGNYLAPSLLVSLRAEHPLMATSVRTVRLDTDSRQADRYVSGTPLWRRAEPDNDPALAALLADDIAAWVRACEG